MRSKRYTRHDYSKRCSRSCLFNEMRRDMHCDTTTSNFVARVLFFAVILIYPEFVNLRSNAKACCISGRSSMGRRLNPRAVRVELVVD